MFNQLKFIIMQKELKIEIPIGYEIDQEKSTFEKIILKKESNKYPMTWEEFCKEKEKIKKYEKLIMYLMSCISESTEKIEGDGGVYTFKMSRKLFLMLGEEEMNLIRPLYDIEYKFKNGYNK